MIVFADRTLSDIRKNCWSERQIKRKYRCFIKISRFQLDLKRIPDTFTSRIHSQSEGSDFIWRFVFP